MKEITPKVPHLQISKHIERHAIENSHMNLIWYAENDLINRLRTYSQKANITVSTIDVSKNYLMKNPDYDQREEENLWIIVDEEEEWEVLELNARALFSE